MAGVAYPEATRHGGGLMRAAAAWPGAPRPWLDLSTGINPEPWSGTRAPDAELGRLPDPLALAELEATAARAFGADPVRVAAAAGAEAVLRLLPLMLKARSVAIVGPTYGGHAESWRLAGAAVETVSWAAAAEALADVLVLVNPNNPDGRTVPADAVAALARARSAAGRWLVVDESFVETAPGASVAGVQAPGLIVLRSFGKFYGLAGVRLGFMIAAPDGVARLRGLLGDWPAGADALALGRAAYADAAWRERTLEALGARAAELDALLVAAGFEIVGGTALFRLARAADAGRRFQRLGRAGVLTRPFDYAPDWLRFGLPRAADMGRLRAALEAL